MWGGTSDASQIFSKNDEGFELASNYGDELNKFEHPSNSEYLS
jgi:hypothetical protein